MSPIGNKQQHVCASCSWKLFFYLLLHEMLLTQNIKLPCRLRHFSLQTFTKTISPKYFHFSWSKYNYRLIIRPNSRKYKMSYHLYCRYNNTKCKQIDEPQWLPLLQECLFHNIIWFINKMLNYSFNIEQRRNFYHCIADFYSPGVCLCPQKIARSFNSHQAIWKVFAEYTAANILRW